MSDIVERLRAVAAMDLRTGGFLAHTLDTAKEAADEIEWLRRARVADLEEMERLRAAKRRALQMADLRSKENVELRERLWSIRENLAHIVRQIDGAINGSSSRGCSSPEAQSAAPEPLSE